MKQGKQNKKQQLQTTFKNKKTKEKEIKTTMKNYQINFETKEIIVTKKFLKQAGYLHSEAYRELITLMNELPNFTVRARMVYRTKRAL